MSGVCFSTACITDHHLAYSAGAREVGLYLVVGLCAVRGLQPSEARPAAHVGAAAVHVDGVISVQLSSAACSRAVRQPMAATDGDQDSRKTRLHSRGGAWAHRSHSVAVDLSHSLGLPPSLSIVPLVWLIAARLTTWPWSPPPPTRRPRAAVCRSRKGSSTGAG